MTVAIHGYPKFKFFLPGTNTLAVGAKLFTYEAGSVGTKKTAYKNFDKSTTHTNPIILNANGEVPTALWLDGKYKLVLAPSNDTDPPASPYWTIDSVGDEDLTASVAGVSNKVPNGSFGVDTSGNGTPDNWTLTAGTGNTLAVDTTTQIHGDTSLKFTIASANTADAITDFFEVQEGVQEIIRFALKASAVDANVIVRLKWYTDAQVFVSNTDVYSDSTTNPTSWTDKGYTYTPPSTARYAKLQILVATTGKTVNVDNFRTFPLEDYDVARTITGEWVIGGVAASNLLDKTANEIISGQWSFDNGLTQFGSGAPGNTWSGSSDRLEVGGAGTIYGDGSSILLIENAYANSGWKHQATGGASKIDLSSGSFSLQVAASGAAGTAITWITSLTANIDGGIEIESPTGGSKGVGTANAANGLYVDGKSVGDGITVVTNWTGAGAYTIHDESSHVTGFDIDAVIGTSWESVGPTGSGATNIWTALDDVPTQAKALVLSVYTLASGSSSGTEYYARLHARKTGSSLGLTAQTRKTYVSVTNRSAANETVADVAQVIVPVDSSIRFDLALDGIGDTASANLVGWIE